MAKGSAARVATALAEHLGITPLDVVLIALDRVRLIAPATLLLLSLYGGPVAAQEPALPPNATPEELKKIKEQALARKDAMEALTQEANAAKALAAAQDTAKSPTADQVAAAKAAKELADAKKAQADAEKASSEAASAAAKAKYGDFTASGYAGVAELGTNAGNAEALLLATVAVRTIAREFAASIGKSMSNLKKALLFSSSTVPDFQALIAFNAQHESFKAAQKAVTEQTKDAPRSDTLAQSLASVGLGLEALNKVLSYFKTDYKFQGIEVATTDGMLLAALAGELRALSPAITAQAPAMYQAKPDQTDQQALGDIAAAFGIGDLAAQRARQHVSAQVERETSLAAHTKIKDDATKPKAERDKAEAEATRLQKEIVKAKEAAAQWKALADRIDAWAVKLGTADDKGQVPLANVVRQGALRGQLDDGAALVVVQLHKAGGTGYTKKNILSSLGANPFFVMGGAVASMTAFDGPTGNVLASSLVPVHGGYHSVSNVQEIVNARPADSTATQNGAAGAVNAAKTSP